MTDKERIENLEQENHRLREELKLWKAAVNELTKAIKENKK